MNYKSLWLTISKKTPKNARFNGNIEAANLDSAQSTCKNENFVKTSKKIIEKNLSRSALFHTKTRVSLKYFVNDCFWKQ